MTVKLSGLYLFSAKLHQSNHKIELEQFAIQEVTVQLKKYPKQEVRYVTNIQSSLPLLCMHIYKRQLFIGFVRCSNMPKSVKS